MTTVHTYIRCGNEIYVGDAANQWQMLHRFETEKRARRWERDQNKQRPGSVTVGSPPVQVTRDRIDKLKMDYERRREIARLTEQQAAEMRRDYHVAGLGTPNFNKKMAQSSGPYVPKAYVAPDHDGSSFLRERSAKRNRSRNVRNTRASFGDSSPA